MPTSLALFEFQYHILTPHLGLARSCHVDLTEEGQNRVQEIGEYLFA